MVCDREETIARVDWLLHRFNLALTRLAPHLQAQRIADDFEGPLPELLRKMSQHSDAIIEILVETKEDLVADGCTRRM